MISLEEMRHISKVRSMAIAIEATGSSLYFNQAMQSGDLKTSWVHEKNGPLYGVAVSYRGTEEFSGVDTWQSSQKALCFALSRLADKLCYEATMEAAQLARMEGLVGGSF